MGSRRMKMHYAAGRRFTLCGRRLTIMVPVARDPHRITCLTCGSRYGRTPGGQPGNAEAAR